jgi:hypothetical protein
MTRKRKTKPKTTRIPPAEQARHVRSLPTTWLIVGLYLLLTLVLFRSFVFSDDMLFGTDTMAAGVMFRSVAVEGVRAHGTIPMWDPYIFSGVPFVDAGHGDTFYPLSLLHYVMPIHRALGWKLVITVFLAGLFARGFFRSIGMGHPAAAVGGIMYMFAATLVTYVYAGHDGKMYVISSLPLVMWALEHFLKRNTWTRAVLFGVAYALVMYSMHLQLAFYAAWLIGAYALFRLISRVVAEKKPFREAFALGKLATGVVISVLLAAALVSFVYYTRTFSPRAEGQRGIEWSSSWAFGAEEVAALVVPDWVGESTGGRNTYWGVNGFKLNSEYAGLIPLLLAIVLFFARRQGRAWLFGGAGLFAVVFALGTNTPMFELLYSFVPGLSSMRGPSMIAFLYAFSVITLGVLCLQWAIEELHELLQARWERIRSVFLVAGGLFLLLALWSTVTGGGPASLWADVFHGRLTAERAAALTANTGSITSGLWLAGGLTFALWGVFEMYRRRALASTGFAVIVGLLVLVDVWRVDARFIKAVPYPGEFRRDVVADFLLSSPRDGRVLDLGTHRPNYFALHGLEEAAGHHGNQLGAYDALLGGHTFANLYGNATVMDLANVTYVVAAQQLAPPRFTPLRSFDRITVYRNNGALPRAFVVHRWEVLRDPDAQLSRVLSRGFDPREVVVLDSDPGMITPMDSIDRSREWARLTGDGLLSYELDAHLEAPGILVVSVCYYPAWVAREGDKQVPLLVANSAFWGVPLEAGEHNLTISYEWPIYTLGLRVAQLSTLGVLLFLGIILLRRRRGGS